MEVSHRGRAPRRGIPNIQDDGGGGNGNGNHDGPWGIKRPRGPTSPAGPECGWRGETEPPRTGMGGGLTFGDGWTGPAQGEVGDAATMTMTQSPSPKRPRWAGPPGGPFPAQSPFHLAALCTPPEEDGWDGRSTPVQLAPVDALAGMDLSSSPRSSPSPVRVGLPLADHGLSAHMDAPADTIRKANHPPVEWWKRPPRPAGASGLAPNTPLVVQPSHPSTLNVEAGGGLGGMESCHVCRNGFAVPPPPPGTGRDVMPRDSLLSYFPSLRQQPRRGNGGGTGTSNSNSRPDRRRHMSASSSYCPCCDRPQCPSCRHECIACRQVFCSFCTLPRWYGGTGRGGGGGIRSGNSNSTRIDDDDDAAMAIMAMEEEDDDDDDGGPRGDEVTALREGMFCLDCSVSME
jgi:hypothetical protein